MIRKITFSVVLLSSSVLTATGNIHLKACMYTPVGMIHDRAYTAQIVYGNGDYINKIDSRDLGEIIIPANKTGSFCSEKSININSSFTANITISYVNKDDEHDLANREADIIITSSSLALEGENITRWFNICTDNSKCEFNEIEYPSQYSQPLVIFYNFTRI